MSERLFTLYVEGIADKVFLKQYFQHCFGLVVPDEWFATWEELMNNDNQNELLKQLPHDGSV